MPIIDKYHVYTVTAGDPKADDENKLFRGCKPLRVNSPLFSIPQNSEQSGSCQICRNSLFRKELQKQTPW
jgi:hypothetical protein